MVLRILPFLILLLLVPAWCLDRAFFSRKLGRPGRAVFYAPNLLLLVALVAVAVHESYTLDAAALKGQLLAMTLCLVVPETITALLLGFSLFFKKRPRILSACRSLAIALGLLSFSVMIYGFTAGYKRLVVKDYVYRSAEIPAAFDGYRIVQLTDLHLGTLHGHDDLVENLVDSVNACQPDLIVFTGDIVNYQAEELIEYEPILNRLSAKDGIVSVMGNHDYMLYHDWGSEEKRLANVRLLQQRQLAMGWWLLLNENLVLHRDADSIAVVGVENDGWPRFQSLADLETAQKGLTDSCFRILLSHDPSHWRRKVLPETSIPLTLSGHTHGMQFKLGNFSPSAWFYDEWGGEYVEDGRTLYVSLGAGEVMLPFRLGAWPEINLITLRRIDK